MNVSHVHCQMTDLSGAVILDAAPTDSVATIGFNSTDCDADFATMVTRGAIVLEPPQDRPYGERFL